MLEYLKPYKLYKDSCVEWLGDVPEHWELGRLKSFLSNVIDKDNSSDSHNTFIALEHVESWTGAINGKARESDFSDGLRKSFRDGDILLGKLRPYLAKVTRPPFAGRCVGEFLVLRSNNGKLGGSFAEQLLRSKPAIDVIDSYTYGAKMPRAEWSFIGGVVVPCPSLSEQATIACFLNYATVQIDQLIQANERLIVLMNELKQATIHQAVTGRIDVQTGKPYPKYKESGVEWLDEVPEHWEMRRLRNVGEALIGLTYDPSDVVGENDGLLVLRASNIRDDRIIDADNVYVRCGVSDRLLTREGDILLCSRSGSRALVGKKCHDRYATRWRNVWRFYDCFS